MLPPSKYSRNSGRNVKKNTIFKIAKDIIIKYFFSFLEKKLSSRIIVRIVVKALMINEIFPIALLEKNKPYV